MKLSELAQILSCTLKGQDKEITGLSTLEEANSSELSFLSNPKYISQIESSKAGAIILKKEFADKVETALISEKPYEDFAKSMKIFEKPQGFFKGISDKAYIDPSATIAEDCTIYPFVTVGANTVIGKGSVLFSNVYIGENCTIGENCIIYPNAVIMGNINLGNACCLQAGAVLGAEGFGFIPTPIGIQKIPQIGNVELGDKVEVGANTCIDRAALTTTKIGTGTAIDNLVQIGHNVEVGTNCLIVSQAGMAGSSKLGDNVTIAARTAVAGHLTVGSGSTIAAMSAVAKDVPENSILGGIPTMPHKTYLKSLMLQHRFPELFTRLRKVEKAIGIDAD